MTKRRFWYDTEFIEYPNTIDLISIGIVGEAGQEFYGINNDCDFSKANPWVTQNVLTQLPPRKVVWPESPWMSRSTLMQEVLDFLAPSKKDPVELWGHYSAYDHVALCWLFGPMVDLPEGMPMYTHDIKQLCDWLGNPRLPEEPKDEHHALADARWNKEAWQYLMDSWV